MIDGVLHVSEHLGIGTIEQRNAASSDLAIDSGKPTKDDVVIHEQGILTNPVPRGVESASFERIKDWLDSINIQVAMLFGNAVEPGLKGGRGGFLLVECNFSRPGVAFQIPHVHFNMLGCKLLLLGLELEELLAIDDSSASAGPGTTACPSN
jgi:hypothetical protein